ncbi:ATP-binding cassette domain-containing protein [Thalassospiraceae bacterium LMO-JJ14]|nr:ATP-binding cassette domain-containing protein [Thalassospiraceae bacterium LMO-JJ14]
MGEFFRRLKIKPGLTAEIVAASLFANILALASPLFVIQVLNRYVGQGVDATLAALASGVLIAIALELGFRQARMKLARGLSAKKDDELSTGAFGILTTAESMALMRIPAGERREVVRGLDLVENAYTPGNITAVIDVPFALLFAVALFLLSPHLAMIAIGFLIVIFLFAVQSQRSLRGPMATLSGAQNEVAGLLSNANTATDTVRAFGGRSLVTEAWAKASERSRLLRALIARRQALVQSVTQSAQALMSVFIYSTGAWLVVRGQLDVGLLIGANILSARTLGPMIKFAQLGESFAKAENALAKVREFASLPVEQEKGAKLSQFNGQIEFRDVSFAYPGANAPLFEGLNFKLPPGGVMVVTGSNGAGKSTMAKIAAGLLHPIRGQVLADGVDLKQLDPGWWRSQLMYLPQEPTFINASLRANMEAANPGQSEETLMRIVREVGLGPFVDESPDGMDRVLANGGLNMALGQRRRLAFARAMFIGGKLAVLDEPTESLDDEGTAFVYSALIDMARRGKTIIAFSRNPKIVSAATLILDLDSKPTPVLRQNKPRVVRAENAS